jgi:hypothetical protein
MRRDSWIARGLTGVAAGAAGTALMGVYWKALASMRPKPNRSSEEPTTNKVAADAMERAGLKPSTQARKVGGQVVHWSYGTLWGGVAGLSHATPVKLDAFFGQPFGFALWGAGDLWMLYKLGYARHPREYPVRTYFQSAGAHAAYGFGVWLALRLADKILLRQKVQRQAWNKIKAA